jgi:hypothetical protein
MDFNKHYMEFMPEVSKAKLNVKCVHSEITKTVLIEVVMWNDNDGNKRHHMRKR